MSSDCDSDDRVPMVVVSSFVYCSPADNLPTALPGRLTLAKSYLSLGLKTNIDMYRMLMALVCLQADEQGG